MIVRFVFWNEFDKVATYKDGTIHDLDTFLDIEWNHSDIPRKYDEVIINKLMFKKEVKELTMDCYFVCRPSAWCFEVDDNGQQKTIVEVWLVSEKGALDRKDFINYGI